MMRRISRAEIGVEALRHGDKIAGAKALLQFGERAERQAESIILAVEDGVDLATKGVAHPMLIPR